jgi:DNA modification methylase
MNADVLSGSLPWHIEQGHTLDVLRSMPAGCVHCIVTSPPYWGLRDYGLPAVEWEDGWRGSLGLEPTPQMWLAHMVQIMAECRRVVRNDGTLWLNIGDAYSGSWGNQGRKEERGIQRPINGPMLQNLKLYPKSESNTGSLKPWSLPPKSLMMLPARLAIAMQDDGWILRSEIVWAKRAPIPESVADRPTRVHEMIYQFAKQGRYFFDAWAIREAQAEGTQARFGKNNALAYDLPKTTESGRGIRNNSSFKDVLLGGIMPDGQRNSRSVWDLSAAGAGDYDGEHYATFPPSLPERCIKAGTSEHGCCSKCGAQWRRVVDKSYSNPGNRTTNGPRSLANRHQTAGYPIRLEAAEQSIGWEPGCTCDAGEPIPAVVLDPFSGTGTTVMVARRLNRRAIGIELKEADVVASRKRVSEDLPMFNRIEVSE